MVDTTWLRNTFIVLITAARLSVCTVFCPGGDTAGVISTGQTCAELVTANNAECYNTSFETTCCSSCNSVGSSNQNCLYGDKTTCFAFLCASYSDVSECCLTCVVSTTSATTAPTSSTSTTPILTTSVATPPTSAASLSSAVSPVSTERTSNSPTKIDETSSDGSNGGVIAGAVVGCILGVSLLSVGAFMAFKLLKKEDNKIADDNASSSSVIPEKRDSYQGHTPEILGNYQRRIPDKLDMCSVLQETLDSGCDLPEKLDNYSDTITTAPVPITLHESSTNGKPNNGRVLNGSEQLQHKRDSKHKTRWEDTTNADSRNTHSEITATKLSTHVNVIDSKCKLDKRRHSNILPSLQHTNTESCAVHERLSPAGITVNTAQVYKSAANGVNNILVDNEKPSQTSEEIIRCCNNIDNDVRGHGQVATFTQSEFIFPRFK